MIPAPFEHYHPIGVYFPVQMDGASRARRAYSWVLLRKVQKMHLEVPPCRPAVFLCALLAGPALAAPANGVYDGFDCAAPVSDQRVTLWNDKLVYYETSCRLSMPQPVSGMADATLYWADCRGEGQEWRERTLLMTRMGGDLIIVGDGWSDRYRPCSERKPEVE